MKTKMMSLFFALVTGSLFSQSHCDQVLQDGVFKSTQISSRTEVTQLSKAWLLRQKYESSTSDKGRKMKAIYESLDETYGIGYNETNFNEFKNLFLEEGYQMNSFSSIEDIYIYQTMADNDILEAWSKCIGGDYSLQGRVQKIDNSTYELQLSTIGISNSIKIVEKVFNNLKTDITFPEVINTGDIIRIPITVINSSNLSYIYISGDNKLGNRVSYTMYIPNIKLPPEIDKQKLRLNNVFEMKKQYVKTDGSVGCCIAFAEDSILPKKITIASNKDGFSYDFEVKRFHRWGDCCGTKYDDYSIDTWAGSISGTFKVSNNRILLDNQSINMTHSIPANQKTNAIDLIVNFIKSRNNIIID